MSEGLRPHRHCYFEVELRRYFDKNRGCAIRKTHYECMICGHEFYETVELSHNTPQYKNKNNVLNRNRNRGSFYFALNMAFKRFIKFIRYDVSATALEDTRFKNVAERGITWIFLRIF